MSELKGFPIVDGLKLQLNGEDVVIKNGEIFLNNHQESVFHFHLSATNQLGLYEGKIGKFDAFSNPIEVEEVVEEETKPKTKKAK